MEEETNAVRELKSSDTEVFRGQLSPAPVFVKPEEGFYLG